MKETELIISIDDAMTVIQKYFKVKPEKIPGLYEEMEKHRFKESSRWFDGYMDGLKGSRDAITKIIDHPFE